MRWQSSPGFVPVPLERRSGDSSSQSVSPSRYRSAAAFPIFFLYLCAHGAGCCHVHVIRQPDSAISLLLAKPHRGRGGDTAIQQLLKEETEQTSCWKPR